MTGRARPKGEKGDKGRTWPKGMRGATGVPGKTGKTGTCQAQLDCVVRVQREKRGGQYRRTRAGRPRKEGGEGTHARPLFFSSVFFITIRSSAWLRKHG